MKSTIGCIVCPLTGHALADTKSDPHESSIIRRKDNPPIESRECCAAQRIMTIQGVTRRELPRLQVWWVLLCDMWSSITTHSTNANVLT